MTEPTPQIVPPTHENTGEATQERKRVALRVQSEPLWKYQSLEQFLKELISAIDGMHEDGKFVYEGVMSDLPSLRTAHGRHAVALFYVAIDN